MFKKKMFEKSISLLVSLTIVIGGIPIINWVFGDDDVAYADDPSITVFELISLEFGTQEQAGIWFDPPDLGAESYTYTRNPDGDTISGVGNVVDVSGIPGLEMPAGTVWVLTMPDDSKNYFADGEGNPLDGVTLTIGGKDGGADLPILIASDVFGGDEGGEGEGEDEGCEEFCISEKYVLSDETLPGTPFNKVRYYFDAGLVDSTDADGVASFDSYGLGFGFPVEVIWGDNVVDVSFPEDCNDEGTNYSCVEVTFDRSLIDSNSGRHIYIKGENIQEASDPLVTLDGKDERTVFINADVYFDDEIELLYHIVLTTEACDVAEQETLNLEFSGLLDQDVAESVDAYSLSFDGSDYVPSLATLVGGSQVVLTFSEEGSALGMCNEGAEYALTISGLKSDDLEETLNKTYWLKNYGGGDDYFRSIIFSKPTVNWRYVMSGADSSGDDARFDFVIDEEYRDPLGFLNIVSEEEFTATVNVSGGIGPYVLYYESLMDDAAGWDRISGELCEGGAGDSFECVGSFPYSRVYRLKLFDEGADGFMPLYYLPIVFVYPSGISEFIELEAVVGDIDWWMPVAGDLEFEFTGITKTGNRYTWFLLNYAQYLSYLNGAVPEDGTTIGEVGLDDADNYEEAGHFYKTETVLVDGGEEGFDWNSLASGIYYLVMTDEYNYWADEEVELFFSENEGDVLLSFDPEYSEASKGEGEGSWAFRILFDNYFGLADLEVSYTISPESTAVEGVDYEVLSGVISLPGAEGDSIEVFPIDDDEYTGTKTLIIELEDGEGYYVHPGKKTATLTIYDNDEAPAELSFFEGDVSFESIEYSDKFRSDHSLNFGVTNSFESCFSGEFKYYLSDNSEFEGAYVSDWVEESYYNFDSPYTLLSGSFGEYYVKAVCRYSGIESSVITAKLSAPCLATTCMDVEALDGGSYRAVIDEGGVFEENGLIIGVKTGTTLTAFEEWIGEIYLSVSSSLSDHSDVVSEYLTAGRTVSWDTGLGSDVLLNYPVVFGFEYDGVSSLEDLAAILVGAAEAVFEIDECGDLYIGGDEVSDYLDPDSYNLPEASACYMIADVDGADAVIFATRHLSIFGVGDAVPPVYPSANAPVSGVATVSGNNINISWGANGNSSTVQYRVVRSDSMVVSNWTTGTTVTDSSPNCGTAYTYTITARNEVFVETSSVTTNSATVACGGGGVILITNTIKKVVDEVKPVDSEPVVPVVPEPVVPDPDPIDPKPVDPVVSDPVDPQHLVATTDPAQENGATQDTTVATDMTTTTDTATTTDTTTTTDATPYTDILLGSINMLAESMTAANLANVAEVAGISTEIATTTTDWSYDSNGDGIADVVALASGVDPLASGEEIIQSLFGATEDYTDNLPVVTAGTLRGATTVMSSSGGVLPGKYKPNQKVSVEIRNARGDVIDTIDSFTDNDGKFLAPLGSLVSMGVKTGDEITLVVKSEKSGEGNTIIVKIGKTEDAPKISSTGHGVERISGDADYDAVETHVWNDVLSERLITLFIKGSEFESYFIAVLNKMKEEQGNTRIFTGTAKPGTRVAFMFESLITTSVVIADARGNFSISAPKGLEEGIHKYTGFVTNLKESSVSPAVTGVLRFINPSRIIDDILLKIEG